VGIKSFDAQLILCNNNLTNAPFKDTTSGRFVKKKKIESPKSETAGPSGSGEEANDGEPNG